MSYLVSFCLAQARLSCPLYKLSFWHVLGLLGNLELSSLVLELSCPFRIVFLEGFKLVRQSRIVFLPCFVLGRQSGIVFPCHTIVLPLLDCLFYLYLSCLCIVLQVQCFAYIYGLVFFISSVHPFVIQSIVKLSSCS